MTLIYVKDQTRLQSELSEMCIVLENAKTVFIFLKRIKG